MRNNLKEGSWSTELYEHCSTFGAHVCMFVCVCIHIYKYVMACLLRPLV